MEGIKAFFCGLISGFDAVIHCFKTVSCSRFRSGQRERKPPNTGRTGRRPPSVGGRETAKCWRDEQQAAGRGCSSIRYRINSSKAPETVRWRASGRFFYGLISGFNSVLNCFKTVLCSCFRSGQRSRKPPNAGRTGRSPPSVGGRETAKCWRDEQQAAGRGCSSIRYRINSSQAPETVRWRASRHFFMA